MVNVPVPAFPQDRYKLAPKSCPTRARCAIGLMKRPPSTW